MANCAPFYVDADLCTECSDCIKALPQAFRKVEDEEIAEVFADLPDSKLSELKKVMAECPGHAILWK